MFASTSLPRPIFRATIRGKARPASSPSRFATASRRKRPGDTSSRSDALPLQRQSLLLVSQRQREGVQGHRLGLPGADSGMSEDREPALFLRREGGRRLRGRRASAATRHSLVVKDMSRFVRKNITFPAAMDARLRKLAKTRRTSQSELIVHLVALGLAAELGEGDPLPRYLGSIQGPADLSATVDKTVYGAGRPR